LAVKLSSDEPRGSLIEVQLTDFTPDRIPEMAMLETGWLESLAELYPNLDVANSNRIKEMAGQLVDREVYLIEDASGNLLAFSIIADRYLQESLVFWIDNLVIDPTFDLNVLAGSLINRALDRVRWAFHNAIGMTVHNQDAGMLALLRRRGFLAVDPARQNPSDRDLFLLDRMRVAASEGVHPSVMRAFMKPL
jgi:hypothetical protein